MLAVPDEATEEDLYWAVVRTDVRDLVRRVLSDQTGRFMSVQDFKAIFHALLSEYPPKSRLRIARVNGLPIDQHICPAIGFGNHRWDEMFDVEFASSLDQALSIGRAVSVLVGSDYDPQCSLIFRRALNSHILLLKNNPNLVTAYLMDENVMLALDDLIKYVRRTSTF
jgi:hypothetical protein